MKRKRTLRSLLSGVCCLAMILAWLPALPAAAADTAANTIIMQDDFESYTVGEKFFSAGTANVSLAKEHGYAGLTKMSGTPEAAIVADSAGNKYLTTTSSRPRFLLGTPAGSYTLEFDYSRMADAETTLDVRLGYDTLSAESDKSIKLRVHKNGYVVLYRLNGGTYHYLQTDGSGLTKGTGALPELELNKWYHISVQVDFGNGSISLSVKERDNGSAEEWSGTVDADGTLSAGEVFIDPQGVTSESNAINIDNIKFTNGVLNASGSSSGSGSNSGSGSAADDDSVSVSGGGMITFTDADQIVNTEAVAITAGMGLFAGTTEGKFDPNGTVTRAQMATIIVKMLRGNAFNADNFKGYNKFSDTASFEGGWAEGYINACVQMGIVAGYGDGTFKPGNPVTTAEALTMIINALKVDAGQGDWPTTIMAKAEEMELYGDLAAKPGTYDALTRDQLAVLTYEGMCYSPSNVTGWKVPNSDIIFTNYADALKANKGDVSTIVEAMGDDALIAKVYDMQIAEGTIVANQATGKEYTELSTGERFDIETGLDDIGHYVTMYYAEQYKGENEPGLTYTVYGECQVVVVADEDITTSKDYKAAFGSAKPQLSDNLMCFDGEYNVREAEEPDEDDTRYNPGSSAPMGTYIICDNKVVTYMDPIAAYASQIVNIISIKGKESVTLRDQSNGTIVVSNTEDDDKLVEYKGMKKDDYVVYTVAQGIYTMEQADKVTGIVAATSQDDLGRNVITMGSRKYTCFNGTNATGLNVAIDGVNFEVSYDLYVTADGKYVGYEPSEGDFDLSKVAYLLGVLSVKETDDYGKKSTKYYARGLDMTGKEVMLLVGVTEGEGDSAENYGDVSGKLPTVKLNHGTGVGAFTEYENKACFFGVADATGDSELTKRGIKTLEVFKSMPDFDPDVDDAFVLLSSGKTFAGGVSRLTCNGKGVIFSGKSSSVYIISDGELNDTTALESKVFVGKLSKLGFEAYTIPMLLTPNTDGSYGVEAMFFPLDLDSIDAGNAFYVAADQCDPVAQDPNGYTYEVYNAVTGEQQDLTIDNEGETLVAGFYPANYDADTKTYTLLSRVPRSGENDSSDGLTDYSVYYGQNLEVLTQNRLFTGTSSSNENNIYNIPANKAVVIDTRTDDELEDSIIPEITSLDQIVTLRETNPDYVIYLDICVQDDSESTTSRSVKTVFITDVYYEETTELTNEAVAGLSSTATVRDERNEFIPDAPNVITTVDQLKAVLAADEWLVVSGKRSAGGSGSDVLVVIENIVDSRAAYTVTTAVNNSDYGTVTVGGAVTSEDGKYYGNETYTITATPNDDSYEVKYILVNGTAIEGTTFTPEKDTTITALFWPKGALMYDDFEGYAADTSFTDEVATGHGYAKYEVKGGTPQVDVKAENASIGSDGQYLEISSERPRFTLGTPTGNYRLSFDLRREDKSCITQIPLAKANGGSNMMLNIYDNSVCLQNPVDSGSKYYHMTYTEADGYSFTKGSQSGRKNVENAVYVAADKWYHFDVTVDVTNLTVALTITNTTDNTTLWTGTFKDMDSLTSMTLTDAYIDFNKTTSSGSADDSVSFASQYLDNILFEKVD